MEKDIITELLETIIKALVSEPDEVKIERKVDEMGVLLLVKLNNNDAGMVIGKQGRTIQAVRTVIAMVGMKNHAKINIKLDVPERDSQRDSRPRYDFKNKKSPDDLDLDSI